MPTATSAPAWAEAEIMAIVAADERFVAEAEARIVRVPVQYGGPVPEGTTDCKCSRASGCVGDGKFYMGGMVLNGVFTGKVGVCFGCEGKGYMTEADTRRCEVYWAHFARYM